MKKYLILLLLFITTSAFSQTITTTAVDEWAAIEMNTVREGATVSVNTSFAVFLTIGIALGDDVAHTGTEITVEISGNSADDEDWTTYTERIGPVGTANPEDYDATEGAGETVIAVGSTTGLYDDGGTRWIFTLDNTIQNSELSKVVDHAANTSVTIQDGLKNEHTTADTLFDIAENFIISLPTGSYRYRIIYNNRFDADGSRVYTMSRRSELEAL